MASNWRDWPQGWERPSLYIYEHIGQINKLV